jgi:ketosteroid isomerase-like protein
MSEEQIEIVRREYLAFAARDWAALGTLWHPEIEYEVLMGAGTFRGLDQITQFFDAYAEMYADFRVEAEEIVDLGNHVLVVERLAGRGLMGSGVPTWVHETFARIITFRDDKIWQSKEYPTRAEALEAVGLSE